jgi:hypothetical protein
MRRRLAARLAAVSVAAALGVGACSSGDAVDTGDDDAAGAGALTAAIAGEPDQL